MHAKGTYVRFLHTGQRATHDNRGRRVLIGPEMNSPGLGPLPDINEPAGDRGSSGHRRRDQVRAALVTLPALEISVRRGCATFAGAQTVGIHREAHRAARFPPVETRFYEDLSKPFRFSLALDGSGAGHDHRRDF